MTREEAIYMLYGIRADNLNLDDPYIKDNYDALTIAIKALQHGPKKGHWIKLNVGYGCSECSLATNESGKNFYRYCPNCGAKMESEVNG